MLSSGSLICGSVVVCTVSPYITVVKGLGNARRMRRSEMQDAFESAAVDGVLLAPGAAGLAVLCRSSGVYPSAFLVRLCFFRAFWLDIVISHRYIYIYKYI